VFAVSQIIEKNLHRAKSDASILWINPEVDDCWRALEALANRGSLKLFSQDFGGYSYLQGAGANVEFAAFPTAGEEKYDWIIVKLPRQKALLDMLLDCAVSLLAKDGVLWLAGENKAGIKSADKLLKRHFGRSRTLDNARHCRLYEAGGHLHQARFSPSDYSTQWTLSFAGAGINVVSYPGVFAHGRLDEGTALLLDTLATMDFKGDVLDFACGAGLIGACIAARNADVSVTLLDNNALALRACKETLDANHLNATVLASDGLSEIDGIYDIVVSNPPIHAGVRTDNQMGMNLLKSIRENISPGGKLILVANVHLPYENWLSKQFKKVNELAANENYKVIAAKK